MIYFRTNEIACPSKSIEEMEGLINQKTSRVKSLFDFEPTLGYVILEERPLAGKKLASGEVIISRYRHSIFFSYT